MEHPLVDGDDEILKTRTAFSAGFQKDPLHPFTGEKLRHHYGPSTRAFGHPGAGGSIAFADPETRCGIAFVLNEVRPGLFPSPLMLQVVHAALQEALGR
jgi:CubicO group peptidase (beta-lactamase class C family)